MTLQKNCIVSSGLFVFLVLLLFVVTACPTPMGPGNESSTYSVIYAANGADSGSIPIDSNNYNENDTVTILGNSGSLGKTGHTYLNWNSKSDGSGTGYSAGDTFTIGMEDIILYAQWSVNSYTVSYDANESLTGTVPTGPVTYEFGTTVTTLDNTGDLDITPVAGTAEAFKFGGWNSAPDGSGTNYQVNEMFSMIASDLTLYAKWVSYDSGDKGPAGGLVFYDKGIFVDGWRYLEAALKSTETTGVWGDDTSTISGADGTAIGTGKQNTADIIAEQGSGSIYAAQICDGLNHGGYNDWFLPSKDELNQMHQNLHLQGTGEFGEDNGYFYFSSSEISSSDVWWQLFMDGSQFSGSKQPFGSVTFRPARVF